jgi:hypothetical protein
MTAIAIGFARAATRESELAVIVAFCLAGMLLSFVSFNFGLDVEIVNLI